MSTPTVIQSAAVSRNATNSVVTLGSAPTNGNLLIAHVTDNILYLNTGAYWSQAGSTFTSGSASGAVLYHYVGPGESATLPAAEWSGGAAYADNQTAVHVWEINGAGSSIGAALDKIQFDAYGTSATSGSTTSVTTGAANERGLVSMSATVFPGSSPYPTITSPWIGNSYAQTYFSAIRGADEAFASSGASVQASFTMSGTSSLPPISIVTLLKPGGHSTETSTAALAFGGISFTVAVADSHGIGGHMAFAGIAIAGAANNHSLGGQMAFAGISISASVSRSEASTAGLHFAGISISASVSRMGAGGTGLIHFWTFGA